MTTAPRAFRRSIADKAKQERPMVVFTLDWIDDVETDEEGNPVLLRSDTFHATRPTDERLFVVAAATGSEDDSVAAEAAAVMELFRDIMPADEYKTLRSRMLDPDDDVSLEMLQDVMIWLMGEWSTFPTKPALDSSGSQGSTGVKSTGRAPGKGSTRSNSR
jgi:hypothetical protein